MSAPDARPIPLLLPASPGEVCDRLGIDRLKAERLADFAARSRAAKRVAEHLRRLAVLDDLGTDARFSLDALRRELDAVNAELWDFENTVRTLMADGAPDAAIGAIARAIFAGNDRRAGLKRAIDQACGVAPGEDKGYGKRLTP
jgi:hypothetical protein